MDVDRIIRDFAEQQYGLVAREQLLGCTISKDSIKHRLETGMIEKFRRSVYRLSGVAASWEQDVMGMCLWAGPGSVASHRTAAALWRLPNYDNGSLDLSTDRHIAANDVSIYRVKPLTANDTCLVGPIPVTSITRTIVDLAAISPQRMVEDAVDEVLRRRLCTLSDLRQTLRHASRARRSGTRLLRHVLAHTDVRVITTQSTFESRLLRCLSKAGLPRPVPQHTIRHNGEFVAQVDFAYPEAKLAIEAQSYRWHGGPNAHNRDVDRYNRLRDIDWELILVTWQQVTYRPGEVASRVWRHLRERSSL